MARRTLTVDRDGQILTWSEDAEKLLGYSELDVVGQSAEIIIPPHLRGPHNTGFRRFVETGRSQLPEIMSTSALRKSGAVVKLKISVEAVRERRAALSLSVRRWRIRERTTARSTLREGS